MAAQPACEDTAAGGQEQLRTAKRAAPGSAASAKKHVRTTQLLRTGSLKPKYSARPRRGAAAAARQGIQVMATSSGGEEDPSDGEPPTVGKAGSVPAGKEVGLAPGARGALQTSAGGEASGGRVDAMDVDGGRSAAGAAAGGSGEAKEAEAVEDHLYQPATAPAEAAAPAANGSPVVQSKEPCASRVCSHMPPSNSTQRPTASACRASLLSFSSTAAAPGVKVVRTFSTMTAVAACLGAEEQHVQAPAKAATEAVRLPPEPASATLGVEVKPSSSGPILAVAAPAAAAIDGRWAEGGGSKSGASLGWHQRGGWVRSWHLS